MKTSALLLLHEARRDPHCTGTRHRRAHRSGPRTPRRCSLRESQYQSRDRCPRPRCLLSRPSTMCRPTPCRSGPQHTGSEQGRPHEKTAQLQGNAHRLFPADDLALPRALRSFLGILRSLVEPASVPLLVQPVLAHSPPATLRGPRLTIPLPTNHDGKSVRCRVRKLTPPSPGPSAYADAGTPQAHQHTPMHARSPPRPISIR